jgi:hypothetical protein
MQDNMEASRERQVGQDHLTWSVRVKLLQLLLDLLTQFNWFALSGFNCQPLDQPAATLYLVLG